MEKGDLRLSDDAAFLGEVLAEVLYRRTDPDFSASFAERCQNMGVATARLRVSLFEEPSESVRARAVGLAADALMIAVQGVDGVNEDRAARGLAPLPDHNAQLAAELRAMVARLVDADRAVGLGISGRPLTPP